MKWLAVVLMAGLMGSCIVTPAPNPIPPPDLGTGGSPPVWDAGGSPCDVMCANLAAISCPEGVDINCVPLCITITTDTRFSPTAGDAAHFLECRTNAKTQAQAQQCGPASCR